MKKLLWLLLIIGLGSHGMSHFGKSLLKHRFYSTVTKPQWPAYSIEQAFLITEITLRNNRLTHADAYDWDLKDKIEKAAAQVCPDHRPSKCSTCSRPQRIAFSRVSEAIVYRKGH